MNKLYMNSHVEQELKLARETYGNKNQILVCIEELNELACVLAKYPRYDEETKATEQLYDSTLDEVADVMIILNHVINIFNMNDADIDERIAKKVARLSRWLEHSNSMQETIDDRAVEESCVDNRATQGSICESCSRKECTEENYENYCCMCFKAQATEGVAPFYDKIN